MKSFLIVSLLTVGFAAIVIAQNLQQGAGQGNSANKTFSAGTTNKTAASSAPGNNGKQTGTTNKASAGNNATKKGDTTVKAAAASGNNGKQTGTTNKASAGNSATKKGETTAKAAAASGNNGKQTGTTNKAAAASGNNGKQTGTTNKASAGNSATKKGETTVKAAAASGNNGKQTGTTNKASAGNNGKQNGTTTKSNGNANASNNAAKKSDTDKNGKQVGTTAKAAVASGNNGKQSGTTNKASAGNNGTKKSDDKNDKNAKQTGTTNKSQNGAKKNNKDDDADDKKIGGKGGKKNNKDDDSDDDKKGGKKGKKNNKDDDSDENKKGGKKDKKMDFGAFKIEGCDEPEMDKGTNISTCCLAFPKIFDQKVVDECKKECGLDFVKDVEKKGKKNDDNGKGNAKEAKNSDASTGKPNGSSTRHPKDISLPPNGAKNDNAQVKTQFADKYCCVSKCVLRKNDVLTNDAIDQTKYSKKIIDSIPAESQAAYKNIVSSAVSECVEKGPILLEALNNATKYNSSCTVGVVDKCIIKRLFLECPQKIASKSCDSLFGYAKTCPVFPHIVQAHKKHGPGNDSDEKGDRKKGKKGNFSIEIAGCNSTSIDRKEANTTSCCKPFPKIFDEKVVDECKKECKVDNDSKKKGNKNDDSDEDDDDKKGGKGKKGGKKNNKDDDDDDDDKKGKKGGKNNKNNKDDADDDKKGKKGDKNSKNDKDDKDKELGSKKVKRSSKIDKDDDEDDKKGKKAAKKNNKDDDDDEDDKKGKKGGKNSKKADDDDDDDKKGKKGGKNNKKDDDDDDDKKGKKGGKKNKKDDDDDDDDDDKKGKKGGKKGKKNNKDDDSDEDEKERRPKFSMGKNGCCVTQCVLRKNDVLTNDKVDQTKLAKKIVDSVPKANQAAYKPFIDNAVSDCIKQGSSLLDAFNKVTSQNSTCVVGAVERCLEKTLFLECPEKTKSNSCDALYSYARTCPVFPTILPNFGGNRKNQTVDTKSMGKSSMSSGGQLGNAGPGFKPQ